MKVYTEHKKLPGNIYLPFAFQYAESKQAVFLPQVLWPAQASCHLSIFQQEVSQLKHEGASSGDDGASSSMSAQKVIQPLLSYHRLTPYIFRFMSTSSLPQHDMLYYMEMFFGTCMIDRTGVLKRSGVIVKVLDPIPALDKSFKTSISDLCDERAREIFRRAEQKNIDIRVAWSGGIDSTTALVALLRTGHNAQKNRIKVLLNTESISEYPLFYEQFIRGRLQERRFVRLEEMYMRAEGERDFLLVTGELGDQIFGSMFYKACVKGPKMPNITPLYGALQKSWRSVMPAALAEMGAIPQRATSLWLSWMEPQVARSPIAIEDVRDFLWWINFSLKWQNVVVRLMNLQETANRSNYDKTEHFFRTEAFQQWSFKFHHLKFPVQTDILSYKQPLKDYIYQLTRDPIYRLQKTKQRSLQTIVSNMPALLPNLIALDEDFNQVTFPRYSVRVDSFKAIYGKYPQGDFQAGQVDSSLTVRGEEWKEPNYEKTLANAFFRRKERVKVKWLGKKLEIPSKDEAPLFVLQMWAFTHQRKNFAVSLSRNVSNEKFPNGFKTRGQTKRKHGLLRLSGGGGSSDGGE